MTGERTSRKARRTDEDEGEIRRETSEKEVLRTTGRPSSSRGPPLPRPPLAPPASSLPAVRPPPPPSAVRPPSPPSPRVGELDLEVDPLERPGVVGQPLSDFGRSCHTNFFRNDTNGCDSATVLSAVHPCKYASTRCSLTPPIRFLTCAFASHPTVAVSGWLYHCPHNYQDQTCGGRETFAGQKYRNAGGQNRR
jgi:hypothetical protein